MLIPAFSIALAIIISMLLLLVSYFLSARSYLNREKSSPFECGFNPKSSARIPFSLRFFLLAVIFLIFDIEIVLLFPLIPALTFTQMTPSLLTGMIFIIILLMGLFHEWNQGSLTWAN